MPTTDPSERSRVRVLFLSATPRDTVRLAVDEEYRAVTTRVAVSPGGARFEFVYAPALRVDELAQALERHTPDLVHFSGHGSDDGELVLVGDDGAATPVSAAYVAEVFRILRDDIPVHGVVLNACGSEVLGRALAQTVSFVVGTPGALGDRHAVSFSGEFYRGLASGRSVDDAFQLARALVGPVAPESCPAIFARDGVDLDALRFARRPNTAATDTISPQESAQARPRGMYVFALFDQARTVKVADAALALRDIYDDATFRATTDASGLARVDVGRPRTVQCDVTIDRSGTRRRATLPILTLEPVPGSKELELDQLLRKENWSPADAASAPEARFESARIPAPPRADASVLGSPEALPRHLPWGVPPAEVVVARASYVVGFDPRLRSPRWVAYKITNTTPSPRLASSYLPDPLLAREAQIPTEAYRGSSYDRGALVRRIDVEAAHERTVFYLSVTVPQLDVVNQGVWMDIEDEASDAARAGDVWVIAGPVFAPALGGGASIVVWGAGLAVPTHFYRIHVRAKSPGGALEARAWLVPNTQEAGRQAKPESFATTVALIERVTGLRFFTEGLTAEARARLVDEVGAAW